MSKGIQKIAGIITGQNDRCAVAGSCVSDEQAWRWFGAATPVQVVSDTVHRVAKQSRAALRYRKLLQGPFASCSWKDGRRLHSGFELCQNGGANQDSLSVQHGRRKALMLVCNGYASKRGNDTSLSGKEQMEEKINCPDCEGKGERVDFSTSMDNYYSCSRCNGTGKIPIVDYDVKPTQSRLASTEPS